METFDCHLPAAWPGSLGVTELPLDGTLRRSAFFPEDIAKDPGSLGLTEVVLVRAALFRSILFCALSLAEMAGDLCLGTTEVEGESCAKVASPRLKAVTVATIARMLVMRIGFLRRPDFIGYQSGT